MSICLYDRFLDATKDGKIIMNTIPHLTKQILKETNKTAIMPFGKDRLYYYGIILKCSVSGQMVFGKVAMLSVKCNDDNDYFSWKYPVEDNDLKDTEVCIYENNNFNQGNIKKLVDFAEYYTKTYIRHINEEGVYDKYCNNMIDLHLKKV